MKANGHRQIAAPPAEVAATLADPAALARVLPSCEEVVPTGPGRYDVAFARKVGPMMLRLRATLSVEALPGGGQRLTLAGRSAIAGSVQAVCTLTLIPVHGGTRVEYGLNIETGGLLRRLAAAAAPDAVEQGAGRLVERLKAEVEGAPA